MQTQVKVGVGNISSVADVLDVPQFAVEGIPNFSEELCERAQLTCLIGGLRVVYSSDEEQTELVQLGYSRQ